MCAVSTNYEWVEQEVLQNLTPTQEYSLSHDIFFAEGLYISTEGGQSLVRGLDYELVGEDILGGQRTKKFCFQRLRFLFPYEKVFVSYYVYCDLIPLARYNRWITILQSLNTDSLLEKQDRQFYSEERLSKDLALKKHFSLLNEIKKTYLQANQRLKQYRLYIRKTQLRKRGSKWIPQKSSSSGVALSNSEGFEPAEKLLNLHSVGFIIASLLARPHYQRAPILRVLSRGGLSLRDFYCSLSVGEVKIYAGQLGAWQDNFTIPGWVRMEGESTTSSLTRNKVTQDPSYFFIIKIA